MTKVLALDGATRTSGVAVLEHSGNQPIKLILAERVKLGEDLSIPHRLTEFKARFIRLCVEHQPDVIAIEDLKFNAGAPNFSSLTKVAYIIGIAMSTAFEFNGCDPVMLTATTVRNIIGNTVKRNKKTETRRIVNQRFGSDLTALGLGELTKAQEDVSDAIALGWVTFSKLKNESERIS